MTDYTQSKTFQAITQLFLERWEMGRKKYGQHIDDMVVPTAITGEESWPEMALNEMLDGVVYALRAQQEHHCLVETNKALTIEVEVLREKVYYLTYERDGLRGELFAMGDEVEELAHFKEDNAKLVNINIKLNDQLDKLITERDGLRAELDLLREQFFVLSSELVRQTAKLDATYELRTLIHEKLAEAITTVINLGAELESLNRND